MIKYLTISLIYTYFEIFSSGIRKNLRISMGGGNIDSFPRHLKKILISPLSYDPFVRIMDLKSCYAICNVGWNRISYGINNLPPVFSPVGITSIAPKQKACIRTWQWIFPSISTGSVACFAIDRLLRHLNLRKEIDREGVRNENLKNRLFTIV